MKKFFRILVTVLLVGGWTLAASALHVIRTNDAQPIKIIPKERVGFADTFVDVRAWTVDDAAAHPAVVERLVETGRADALAGVAGDAAQLAALRQRVAEAKAAATTQPAAGGVAETLRRVEHAVTNKAQQVKTSIFTDDAPPAATQSATH
jgi:hypothetical protein